ncbi:hypothetical protein P4050_00585 [Pseudomonas aeruginosa]|nr:hypothetical protein [Pseudomonas aeruginosa]
MNYSGLSTYDLRTSTAAHHVDSLTRLRRAPGRGRTRTLLDAGAR